jgi:hypothetical protein
MMANGTPADAQATTAALNRAALVLGVGALACGVFALTDAVQYRFVRLDGPSLPTLLVLAIVAIAGGWLGHRLLVVAAGAGFLAAAVLQLIQLGGQPNWLRGDGSTFSLFLGLGVGLLVVGLTRAPAAAAESPTSTEGT